MRSPLQVLQKLFLFWCDRVLNNALCVVLSLFVFDAFIISRRFYLVKPFCELFYISLRLHKIKPFCVLCFLCIVTKP